MKAINEYLNPVNENINIDDVSEKFFTLIKEIIDNGSKNPFKDGRCNNSSLKNLKKVFSNVYDKLNDEDIKNLKENEWGYIAHFETAINSFFK